MMSLTADNHNDEPHSTPKLSLSKLPACKPKIPAQMLTPPLQPSLSVPFHWEEAPGKPRSSAGAPPKAARCLHLPPDTEEELTIMPSPTLVLDGPYVGSGRIRPEKMGGCGSFGRSRRWRWFEFGGGGGSFDLSQSTGDFFDGGRKNVKMARLRRGGSFFDFNSNL